MPYPTFLDHSPQNGFIGVQLNAPVFFRVEDSNGLKVNTLHVAIEGIDVILNGVYQPGYSGVITPENFTPTAISVIINHTVDFAYNTHINIASSIENNVSVTGNDTYEFITVPNPDHTAPLVAANPHGELYNSSQSIILSSNEPTTVIYYTLDGTDPILTSSIYSSPIPITQEGQTILKFVGIDLGNNYDKIRIETYKLDFTVPTTVAYPIGGGFFNTIQVVLTCDDSQATIFFTTNGLTPTINSQIYTSPILLQTNDTETIIKFFARDKSGNTESVKTETYSLQIAKNNYRVTNTSVRYNYIERQLELLWEDMYPMFNNVLGYNIYRADTEFDKYVKLNNDPITVNQYLDKTLDTQIINEDVSEQFRRTVNISRNVNDSFKGQIIDETKWKQCDIAQLLFQYDGLIFTDKVGLSQESKLSSKFKLKGNFDIQIDFDLRQWSIPNSTISSCIFRVKREDTNFIQVAREKSQTSDIYSSYKFVNGNPDLPVTIPTIDDYGTFKITRLGTNLTTYFLDKTTSNFVIIQSYNWYVDDLYIEIVGRSSDVPCEVQWYNFKLNLGQPIIIQPLNQLKEYVIQTSKFPIVDNTGTNKATDDISQVQVTINGQSAFVKLLQGLEGHIYLETDKVYDEVKRVWIKPPVPNEYSAVLVTYKTPYHTTDIKKFTTKDYFYKISIVTAEDETDLDLLKPEHLQSERLTYIWEEAIRRNSWLRDQGGERVLAYLKKKAGQICSCTLRDVKQRTHRKPDKDCPLCFGSGFVGGFDGPFPIIVGNLTAEQRIMQTERGMKLQLQVETWCGPFPIITQRDMLIRRNGERCLIGPVTKVDWQGEVIQQHFSIEHLDSTDIRYTFGVQPLPNQFIENTSGIDKDGIRVPTVTSSKEREELVTSIDKVAHENKNVDRQVRGRSLTFENIEY